MKKLFWKHFHWYSDKLRDDNVDSFSAQVAFFIMIAFIPFVLFLLSILQSINISGTSLLNAAIGIFPKEVQNFLLYVLVQHSEPIALLSVAAFTCLWSSSKAMLALIKGLNSVFDVEETRNFVWLRIVSIGYTAIFAVILAATTVVLVFGNTIYNNILTYFDPGVAKNLIEGKSLVGFVILLVFFTFSYRIIPRKAKISLWNCIWGGAFSAAGWVLFSFFFSLFVENFGNYSGMYGSLAALVILMLWLYFCMYILFLGGEISIWLETGGIKEDIKKLWVKQKRPKKRI